MENNKFDYRLRTGLLGATARMFYGAYLWFDDVCEGIEADKVRVFCSQMFNSRVRLFHHISQLKKHLDSEEKNFIVRSQAQIDYLLWKSDQEVEHLESKGEMPLCEPAFDYLDRSDKSGSYINFHDQEGLLEGKIVYTDERSSAELGFNAGKIVLGNFIGLNLAMVGAQYQSQLLVDLGLVVSIFMGVDGFWKGFRSIGKQYFDTEIKTKDDSEKARKKLEMICEKINGP